jgi:type I restriction enzyme S subunit
VVQYGAAQEQFNISHAADFLIPVPPREEQAVIVSSLNQEKQRIDALLHKTERSIELLKERRSTLITAAVTGQIDLRDAA